MKTTDTGAPQRMKIGGAEAVQRLRVTFSQSGAMRYVGHLDVVRTWERALRRAGTPLAYSGGFNPGPRLYFASGLPLGATGRAEIVDVLLVEAMPPAAFQAAIGSQLPVGLTVLHVEEAPLKTPALQAVLLSSLWQIDVESDASPEQLAERVQTLLAQPSIPAQKRRKGQQKSYDLRPLILAVSYDGQPEPGWRRLSVTLRSEPSATGRADALLEALGLGEALARIERVQLTFAEIYEEVNLESEPPTF
ncbi:MAG: TIGR03936 family radical SAM-associated protein [Anaerolineae bacterium]